MSYIDRNEAGQIVGIYACQQRPAQEWLEGAVLYVLAKTKAQRIADVLAPLGESRLTIQMCILVSENEAKAQAAAYGLTPAQAIAFAYQKNKAYKTCKDLEVQMCAIEAEA